MNYIENVVIGNPICLPSQIFAVNAKDWDENEAEKTIRTNERSLAKILVELGIAKSISEVRRNKPELNVQLTSNDYLEVKWGKRKLFILVGAEGNVNKYIGKSFLQQCVDGTAEIDEIDDFIEHWHTVPEDEVPLHSYLGFSKEDFANWIKSDASLEDIVNKLKATAKT